MFFGTNVWCRTKHRGLSGLMFKEIRRGHRITQLPGRIPVIRILEERPRADKTKVTVKMRGSEARSPADSLFRVFRGHYIMKLSLKRCFFVCFLII